MKKSIVSIFMSIFLMFIFSGCVQKMERAPIAEDKLAKEFKTDPDFANLYICRNESFGWAVHMPVLVNDKLIGRTEAQSYFYIKLEEGRQNIKSLTEQIQSIYVDTTKGKNYFVWQEVKMGTWVANSMLHSMNDEDGKKCVQSSHMLKIDNQR
jgi:PBP1b-binding outer membrane lipoprotein LpoB